MSHSESGAMHLPDSGAMTPVGIIVFGAGTILGVATQSPWAAFLSAVGLIIGSAIVRTIQDGAVQRFLELRRERDRLRRENDDLALRLGQYERVSDPDKGISQ